MISAIAASTFTVVSYDRDPEFFHEHVSLSVHIGALAEPNEYINFIIMAAGHNPYLLPTMRNLGVLEYTPYNPQVMGTLVNLCRNSLAVCDMIRLFVFEDDIQLDDTDSFINFLSHNPMGSSTKAMEHIMQWYQNHDVRYFDYGIEGNLQHYGSEDPPEIEFDRARGIPIALINGLEDDVGDLRNSNEFFTEHNLGPIVYNGTYDYGHYSYYIGLNMTYLDDLYSVIQDYAPELISSY